MHGSNSPLNMCDGLYCVFQIKLMRVPYDTYVGALSSLYAGNSIKLQNGFIFFHR
jgi:hypothetical protein